MLAYVDFTQGIGGVRNGWSESVGEWLGQSLQQH